MLATAVKIDSLDITLSPSIPQDKLREGSGRVGRPSPDASLRRAQDKLALLLRQNGSFVVMTHWQIRFTVGRGKSTGLSGTIQDTADSREELWQRSSS